MGPQRILLKSIWTGHQAVSLNSSQGLQRLGIFFSPLCQQENWLCGILFQYLYPSWLLPEWPNSSPMVRIHTNANKSPWVSISDDIVLLNCFPSGRQSRVSSSWLAWERLPARLPLSQTQLSPPYHCAVHFSAHTRLCVCVCVSVQVCCTFRACFSLPACLVRLAGPSVRGSVFPQEGYQAWRWSC